MADSKCLNAFHRPFRSPQQFGLAVLSAKIISYPSKKRMITTVLNIAVWWPHYLILLDFSLDVSVTCETRSLEAFRKGLCS